jgi:hypothetical protein
MLTASHRGSRGRVYRFILTYLSAFSTLYLLGQAASRPRSTSTRDARCWPQAARTKFKREPSRRNFNACLAKPAINLFVEITFDMQAVVDLHYPSVQVKIERSPLEFRNIVRGSELFITPT